LGYTIIEKLLKMNNIRCGTTSLTNAQMIGYLMEENKYLKDKIAILEKQIRVQDGLYCVLLELLISKKQIFNREELITLCEKHAQHAIANAQNSQRIEVATEMKNKIQNVKNTLDSKKTNTPTI